MYERSRGGEQELVQTGIGLARQTYCSVCSYVLSWSCLVEGLDLDLLSN
jgi:hypothetical protein